MMTQQYPLLKYSAYLIIFAFHLFILGVLYNYSTKSSVNHLGWDGSPKQELYEHIPNNVKVKSEPTVSVQHEGTCALLTPHAKANNTLCALKEEKQLPESCTVHPTVTSSIVSSSKSDDSLYNDKIDHATTKAPLNLAEVLHPTSPRSLSFPKTSIPSDISSTDVEAPKPEGSRSNEKLNIPPAAFMQAFKNSYYQEQNSLGNLQAIPKAPYTEKESVTDSQSLITQRLGDLKISDYIQQIKKAFYEAAKRTPGMYMNSGKELKTDLDVQLEIQSQGTVKVSHFQSSGIEEIDAYIKKFLSDIIVNPIPKRYKVKMLPFATKILINLDKNTRFYTIRCFF